MLRFYRLLPLVFTALALAFTELPFTHDAAADSSLASALRNGGFVIYFRHSQTEWSQSDKTETNDGLHSCNGNDMRQLTATGRELMRKVGAAMRQLKIPVDQIYSSEYCRCRETAELLALGRVQITRDLINDNVAHLVGGREALAKSARQRLSTPPPARSNTVLVSHGNVMVLAGGERPVEGGAAIVRPEGNGNFTLIAMLKPEEWLELASAIQR